MSCNSLLLRKHRIIPKVTVGMKRAALNQILLEEKNLGLLDNPYISKVNDFSRNPDRNFRSYFNLLSIKKASETFF